jgi:hypothetical protein
MTGCMRTVKDAEVDAYFWQIRKAIDDFKKHLWENPPPRDAGAFVDMSDWICPIVRPELLERMLETGDYKLEVREVAMDEPNYFAPADRVWTLTGNRLSLFNVEKLSISTAPNYCQASLGSDLAFCC